MGKTFRAARNVATEWETRLRAILTKWGERHQTKVPVVSYSGYFTTSVPERQQCFGCAVGGGAGGGGGGGGIHLPGCRSSGKRAYPRGVLKRGGLKGLHPTTNQRQ